MPIAGMTVAEFRAELKARCDAAGGVVAFCKAKGLNRSTVSDFLGNRRGPSEEMAAACGKFLQQVLVEARPKRSE